MLKRSRAPSPSPTHPDPSSPPPLDSSVHRVIKRRRTAGPALDSYERRDSDKSADDGEDDFEGDDDQEEKEDGEDAGSGTRDKMYEHVNHVLHGLHTEQQHRSRAQHMHPVSQSRPQDAHVYRGRQSPASSLVKSGHSLSTVAYRDRVESQESDDGVERDHFDVDISITPRKGDPPTMQDDEGLRVMHRYEDTNRLLGSLVLSRRRTLGGTPPRELE